MEQLENTPRIRVRTPGKINLALRSGPRQTDGYHQLATVFQAVSSYDEVTAEPAEPGQISIQVQGLQADQVPTGPENLVWKAAISLAAWAKRDLPGVRFTIDKQIPVTGGMAGGSADAAAALLACAKLWDIDINASELSELGVKLGADVPFCLHGGTALGVNRGDQLTPVLSRGTYHWVLALCSEGLSTPAVFNRFDELSPKGTAPLEIDKPILNALAAGDIAKLGKSLVNDLQPAALSLRPALWERYNAGLELGALGAIISGSGPTIAFLCASDEAAIDLSVKLSSAGVGQNLRRVHGPVAGARIVS